MAIQIEQYKPSPELMRELVEVTSKISEDVQTETICPLNIAMLVTASILAEYAKHISLKSKDAIAEIEKKKRIIQ